MSDNIFIPVAYASPSKATAPAGSPAKEVTTAGSHEVEGAVAETGTETAHASGGIEIQPTTIAFQALNFIVLAVVLHLILYKPITKLLTEREKRIKDGVENAEKADLMLKESNQIRQDMIKNAQVEANDMLEKSRKSGETLKNSILHDAHQESHKIVQAGHNLIEMEKEKVAQDLRLRAVNLIVGATEKILREKIDPVKDAQLIEENLKSFAS